LLELGAAGRWRFAGRPIGSERGLLCAPGDETTAWSGLAGWLGARSRRWATLEAACVPAAAESLPGARRRSTETTTMALPDSFDAYLAGRSRVTRSNLKRNRRRAERAGAEVRPVPAAEVDDALRDFVVLHQRRATSIGERHPAVDARLADVLLALRDNGLRLFELVHDGRRAGVNVRLDRGATVWSYNSGFDPDAAELAPGISLELASIHDAIDRGCERYDLGPGIYPFKLQLGMSVEPRADVRAISSSARGRLLGPAAQATQNVRARVPVRTIIRARLKR
jgi:CelD/BcsL family acetyltransferase involved in cellulose biosynthesis